MKAKKYSFRARVWRYKGPSGWHFVTLPKKLATTIRKIHFLSEEGWGRLPANASIGGHLWKTAIWFDSKANSYLLPIKATVRKAKQIESGKLVSISLLIQKEEPRSSIVRSQKGI